MFANKSVDELMNIKNRIAMLRNPTRNEVYEYAAAKEELDRRNSEARDRYKKAISDAS